MIRLTWKLGEKSGALYVPENVIVLEHEGKTFVTQSLDDHATGIEVTESPEEVARKALEWRLAWEGGDVETLYQMAGLEEPNHDTDT